MCHVGSVARPAWSLIWHRVVTPHALARLSSASGGGATILRIEHRATASLPPPPFLLLPAELEPSGHGDRAPPPKSLSNPPISLSDSTGKLWGIDPRRYLLHSLLVISFDFIVLGDFRVPRL